MKLTLDLSTGETVAEDVTDEDREVFDRTAREQESMRSADAEREAQRQADLATLREAARTDPVSAAYARLLGLPSE